MRSSFLRQKRLWGAAACVLALLSIAPATAAHLSRLRVHTFVFVDRSRTIRSPGGRDVARTLATVVWWPASRGPHPLLVFAHGFALTPADYAPLLRAIASAGYVVGGADLSADEHARAWRSERDRSASISRGT